MKNHVSYFVICSITSFTLNVVPGWAQEPKGNTRADEKAIRQTAEAFTKAFNCGDAKAVAALWAPDGEYIDESGAVTSGRAEIEKQYTAFFKERAKAQMQVLIDSIRFLSPTVAIEEGTSRLNEPSVGDTSAARYRVLHVKQDGQWLMASVQDYASASLSNYKELQALEPLIGDWVARRDEGRVETSCSWIENRNFIKRKFTTYRGDKVVGSGFEIIGIDPRLGQITSWHFSDDGGVGRCLWLKDDDSWIIQANGTMPDGRPTYATNVLTRVDGDTYTWISRDRAIEGQRLPDAPITRIIRSKKAK